MDICGPESFKKAYEIGKAIAESGAVLVNGATTGTPYEAARGAKKAGGTVIGLSPAATKKEHVNKYRLPLDYVDLVIYTGFGYAGRNLLLTRSSDAVIVACGRIGTLNEFTIAFEDKKPIGVLTDSGGVINDLDEILEHARRGQKNIIFDADPKRLVKKVLQLVKSRDKKIRDRDHKNHLGRLRKRTALKVSVPE